MTTLKHLVALAKKWRAGAKEGYEKGTMSANPIRMLVACADELESALALLEQEPCEHRQARYFADEHKNWFAWCPICGAARGKQYPEWELPTMTSSPPPEAASVDAKAAAEEIVAGSLFEPDTTGWSMNKSVSKEMVTERIAAIIRKHISEGKMPGIPEGYVMVPREPTEAMIDSGGDAWANRPPEDIGYGPSLVGIYKAMLAAAPETK